MQTFLPFPSMYDSLNCLDNKQLGKQRVETHQILNVLKVKKTHQRGGRVVWANHPAVLMWEGYEGALTYYYNISLILWEKRGFKNEKLQQLPLNKGSYLPWWWGYPRFHESHKSNLLRKDPVFYKSFESSVETNLDYVWPTNNRAAIMHWRKNRKKDLTGTT